LLSVCSLTGSEADRNPTPLAREGKAGIGARALKLAIP
jgi:hypothetical protein